MNYFDYLPEVIISTAVFTMYVLGRIRRSVLEKSKAKVNMK